MKGLKQIRITHENMEKALEIQHEIFPHHNARKNFEESLKKNGNSTYFILSDGYHDIGVSGIYECPADPHSAWLGWFGILNSYRRKGYGTKSLNLFESVARKKGYRYARLYTDRNQNDAAISFYKANGYQEEEYLCGEDAACKEYPVLIFSKSLGNHVLCPWGNKSIHLTEQVKKQSEPEL